MPELPEKQFGQIRIFDSEHDWSATVSSRGHHKILLKMLKVSYAPPRYIRQCVSVGKNMYWKVKTKHGRRALTKLYWHRLNFKIDCTFLRKYRYLEYRDQFKNIKITKFNEWKQKTLPRETHENFVCFPHRIITLVCFRASYGSFRF